MDFAKLHILGSGFTNDEYELYNFDKLRAPNDAMSYLSHKLNNEVFRPTLNAGVQKHFLEDKWMSYCYLQSLGLPIPKTFGLFHPEYGTTIMGSPMKTGADIVEQIADNIPCRLFFKPRGGRKARNVFVVDLEYQDDGVATTASHGAKKEPLDAFLNLLPSSADDEYDGSYHGWLVQAYIQQHPFFSSLNPCAVNTLRVITNLNSSDKAEILTAVLKLGRKGNTVDAWSKGGVCVEVDASTGKLGYGLMKPKFGRDKLSAHPDTGEQFFGATVPCGRCQPHMDSHFKDKLFFT